MWLWCTVKPEWQSAWGETMLELELEPLHRSPRKAPSPLNVSHKLTALSAVGLLTPRWRVKADKAWTIWVFSISPQCWIWKCLGQKAVRAADVVWLSVLSVPFIRDMCMFYTDTAARRPLIWLVSLWDKKEKQVESLQHSMIYCLSIKLFNDALLLGVDNKTWSFYS